MKIAHSRNWNMARKLTNEENEKLTWQERNMVRNSKKGSN